MVCEHFKANQGQGSKNSFISLYHANFIASCSFSTGTDEMQGFSLSVLIPFFPLFLWCLPISKCNSAAASQVKPSWKSLWKHCDLKQPSSAQLHYRVQGKPLVAKFDAATLAVRNRLKECNSSGFHFCLKGRVAQWTHNETWERGKGKLNYIQRKKRSLLLSCFVFFFFFLMIEWCWSLPHNIDKVTTILSL